MIKQNEIQEAIDFLTQANYNHNRKLGETPKRLALIFGKGKVEIMEKNFSNRLTIAQK
jgi:hypothetical protein